MSGDAAMNFFNLTFWQGAIGNVIGSCVGVVVGLWWGTRAERRSRKTARVRLLESLSLALQQSSELLQRLNDGLSLKTDVAGTTTFTFVYTLIPVTVFDATAVVKYEMFQYRTVCGLIDAAALGIKEINQKVEALHAIYPLCLSSKDQKLDKHASQLVQQIKQQILQTLTTLQETQDELGAIHHALTTC
jgi:hypothetical protein